MKSKTVKRTTKKKAAKDLKLKAVASLAEIKARKQETFRADDESSKISTKGGIYVSDILQYLREKVL